MFRLNTWLQSPAPLRADGLYQSVLEPDLWRMSELERRYLREARAVQRLRTINLFQPNLPNLLDA
ncbi:hypothetical protein [Leptolyngbya sp. 7M]|uniref:hypothetical protein n=1 Tax=Leptolyngbya sp. 7M TaxID=2812896 RepID=UPI001B8C86A8|nr:hypothetical protein [Leptolyngbya sp. 7M]QYO64284.1 hypothetical protein JVX88_31955 [Leptolyngbya sp. 7M]